MKIVVQGEPVPQGRPRFSGRGGFVRSYDPPKSREYKKLVKTEAEKQYSGQLMTGSIEVELNIYRPIQKSLTKKERALRLSGARRPIVKGDIDNYFKSVTDACTGTIWNDDAQIVGVEMNKYYSDQPRIEMTVNEIDKKEK